MERHVRQQAEAVTCGLKQAARDAEDGEGRLAHAAAIDGGRETGEAASTTTRTHVDVAARLPSCTHHRTLAARLGVQVGEVGCRVVLTRTLSALISVNGSCGRVSLALVSRRGDHLSRLALIVSRSLALSRRLLSATCAT